MQQSKRGGQPIPKLNFGIMEKTDNTGNYGNKDTDIQYAHCFLYSHYGVITETLMEQMRPHVSYTIQ